MAKKQANSDKSDIGLIGLAVMGQNLALNIADHGYKISVYNRTTSVTDAFMKDVKENEPAADYMVGTKSLKAFVNSLSKPRKIIILVKAGPAVDYVVQDLLKAGVEKNDIVVDCGNSLWTDTIRREKEYASKCKFFGSGVSGGELGARFGPSLMPGGDKGSWKHLRPIWKAISAKVDTKTGKPLEDYEPGKPIKGGVPCTDYIGENGAGHYVKMVHNGIEYADMQLICEAYHLMAELGGLKPDAQSKVFNEWNQGDLASYLIEISVDILQQKDPRNKRRFLVDQILDTAGQKGTGKWTAANALDMGIPANAIAEAVFARCLSAIKEERVEASKKLKGPKPKYTGSKAKLVEMVRDALYCSKICAYAQGFQLMSEAQREYDWKLKFGSIAKIWRGGCIIRADFLQKITEAYERDAKLQNLMLDPYFKKKMKQGQENWRKIVALAAEHGIPAPAFMSSLAYFDSYRAKRLPANLLQGQRDYFGAHTYERIDEPRGKKFHVDWPEPDRPELKA